jgi:hypothetical protein
MWSLFHQHFSTLLVLKECLIFLRFLFPALGGLLYGYDIGSTSCATISIKVWFFMRLVGPMERYFFGAHPFFFLVYTDLFLYAFNKK